MLCLHIKIIPSKTAPSLYISLLTWLFAKTKLSYEYDNSLFGQSPADGARVTWVNAAFSIKNKHGFMISSRTFASRPRTLSCPRSYTPLLRVKGLTYNHANQSRLGLPCHKSLLRSKTQKARPTVTLSQNDKPRSSAYHAHPHPSDSEHLLDRSSPPTRQITSTLGN